MRKFRTLTLFGTALLALPLWIQFSSPERYSLAVSIIDQDGKALGGLSVTNFGMELKGRPLRIISAVPDTAPRRIALLIDTGPSMRAGIDWERAWLVARDVVSTLGSEQGISVLTIGSTLTRHCSFQSGSERLEFLVSQAETHARKTEAVATSLTNAVVVATREFSVPRPGDAIVLVTNKFLTVDSYRLQEALESGRSFLAQAGIRLYVLTLTQEERPPSLGGFREFSGRLAESSGGIWIELNPYLRKQEQIHKELGRLFYESLAHTYRLEVEVPSPIQKPQELKFEVVDSDGKRLKKLQVSYPHFVLPRSDGTPD